MTGWLGRRAGKRYEAIKTAPVNSLYVCNESDLDHCQHLANQLNRTDLKFVTTEMLAKLVADERKKSLHALPVLVSIQASC